MNKWERTQLSSITPHLASQVGFDSVGKGIKHRTESVLVPQLT
jgi:hypothetical protein